MSQRYSARAGAGAVLYALASAGGTVIWAGTLYLGDQMTENCEEYRAVILGLLAAAKADDIRPLRCRGDMPKSTPDR